MPQYTETTPLSNYTLTKLIRTGISPICAMIGTSAYYGQVITKWKIIYKYGWLFYIFII